MFEERVRPLLLPQTRDQLQAENRVEIIAASYQPRWSYIYCKLDCRAEIALLELELRNYSTGIIASRELQLKEYTVSKN